MRGNRSVLSSLLLLLFFSMAGGLAMPAGAGAQTDEKVSVAGPPTPYLPDAVNEPALAVDANHPGTIWSTARRVRAAAAI
jgi:hypothetical protein